MADIKITYRLKSTTDFKHINLYPIFEITTFEGAISYLLGEIPESAESKVIISGGTNITLNYVGGSLHGDILISTGEYTQIKTYDMGKLMNTTDLATGSTIDYPSVEIYIPTGNTKTERDSVACPACHVKFKNFGSLRSHTNKQHRLSITKETLELIPIGDRSGPRTQ